MDTVRVVWGTATGPTALASYDAALAEAGVGDYNLVPVSSVVPADVDVEAIGTAPDLGPAGRRLTVVQARATGAGPGRVSAALAWSTGGGPGLVYEAAGETGEDDVRERARRGLAAGRALREWPFDDEGIHSVSVSGEPGTYTTAVVLAAFGRGEPI